MVTTRKSTGTTGRAKVTKAATTGSPAAVKKAASGKTVAKKKPAVKAAPAAAPKAARPDRDVAVDDTPKQSLVRDGFTMPEAEYAVLGQLKTRLVGLARPTKKGELLRAGLALLATLSDQALMTAVSRIPSLKTGRPKKTRPPTGKSPKK